MQVKICYLKTKLCLCKNLRKYTEEAKQTLQLNFSGTFVVIWKLMFRKQRAYFLSKKSIYVKQIMSTWTRIDAIPRMFYRQNVSATALTPFFNRGTRNFIKNIFHIFVLLSNPNASTWCIIISVLTLETQTCSRKTVNQFISPVMFSVFHFN